MTYAGCYPKGLEGHIRAGGTPFYGISTDYYLMSAPKGTPSAALKKLEGALRKGMERPEFRKTLDNFFCV